MSMTLTTVFGGSPDVRVVEFFAAHADFDYNISDIARNAGVSRPAAYRVVDRLVDAGVIERTRRLGSSWLYALNEESPLVAPLVELEVKLTQAPAARRRGRTGRGPEVRR